MRGAERGRAATGVLAGDLNCAAQGSGTGPHLRNVKRLAELGVESAYHAHRGLEHGAETAMTLRWKGRGGLVSDDHVDFVFLSRPLLDRLGSVEVGSMDDWVESSLSDHCPVVVDLAPRPSTTSAVPWARSPP